MTYLQTIKEIESGNNKYQTFSDVLFPALLNVKNIPSSKIPDKENEIRQIYTLLEKNLYSSDLTRTQKNDLIDYIERLQIALEILAIKKGKKNINSIEKASRHLAKKMQSSISE